MTGGPLLFARYAYPPNSLGYCGPEDHDALLQYGAAGEVDGGLIELEHSFEGALPYLEAIAAANRIGDPLDERVVAAYWVGNDLLARVRRADLWAMLESRFGKRLGRAAERVAGSVYWGALAHHSFHVFSVYPWIGMLRGGWFEQPLTMLDGCRIRWGRVLDVAGDDVVVASNRLALEPGGPTLTQPAEERAAFRRDGYAQVVPVPGDLVSLHWGWVCDRLSPAQVARLEWVTRWNLALAATQMGGPESWTPGRSTMPVSTSS
jgi:hypothetical protein